jgi:hypothetical protein
MTEEEWLRCPDPLPLLEFLRGKASDRQLRLLACACCRPMEGLLPGGARGALATCERFADGLATEQELVQARQEAEASFRQVNRQISFKKRTIPPPARAVQVVAALATPEAWQAACEAVRASIDLFGNRRLDYLRCIFGNPFRRDRAVASWLSPSLLDSARAIYEEGAFDRMPRLAEALEQSGCDRADVLNHCRQPSDHARGCWVVDLLLGNP